MFKRHHLSYVATVLLLTIIGPFIYQSWKEIPSWIWVFFGIGLSLAGFAFVVGFLGTSLHAIHIHQHREEPVAAAAPRKRVARKKEEV